MSRGPDCSTLLERALVADAARTGCRVRLLASEMTRWASATFVGARHCLTLEAAASPALRQWLCGLAEAELALGGHLVADLIVQSVCREGGVTTTVIEVLTVEER